jgi:hypothetical protein
MLSVQLDCVAKEVVHITHIVSLHDTEEVFFDAVFFDFFDKTFFDDPVEKGIV